MKKYMYGVLSVICALMMVLYYPLMAQQRASDTAATVGSIIPTGTVMAFAGATAPAGWEFAYGQERSQTSATYKNLYAVITTTYCVAGHGAGGVCGGGNFRIPDYRGRVLGGKEDMGGSNPTPRRLQNYITGTTLGANSGSEADTPAGSVPASGLTVSGTVPAHYHTTNAFAYPRVDIDHDHGAQSFSAGASYGTSTHNHGSGTLVAHITLRGGGTIGYREVGGSVYTMNYEHTPGTVAASGATSGSMAGTAGSTDTPSSTGTPSTSVDLSPLGTTYKTPSGSIGSCAAGTNGTCSSGTSGDSTLSLTGAVAGTATISGTAGNNLPPMAVVNYIIKL